MKAYLAPELELVRYQVEDELTTENKGSPQEAPLENVDEVIDFEE